MSFFFGGDPFGGAGGFPGGMGGGPPREVDNNEFYEILGVPKDVDEKTLKKKFRKLAMKNHPDRGGDKETFQRISLAYEVLSDPDKRAQYDRGGKEAVSSDAASGGHSAEDIFSSIFGGQRGGRSRNSGPPKGRTVKKPLTVSLQDLYKGKTTRVRVSRQRIKVPKNMTKADAIQTCQTCGGRGVVMRVMRMGPMIQQMQSECPDCNGTGSKVARGVKLVKEQTILEIVIEKGAKNGTEIKFEGESDEHPGKLPGDIVFVVQEQKHAELQRRNADLCLQRRISLVEALTGVRFTYEHLDGRQILVQSAPGKVIKPMEVMAIEDEGMPVFGNPFTKGKLYVVFNIDFPQTPFTEAQTKVLQSVLPPSINTVEAVGDEVEEVELENFGDVEALQERFGKSHQSNRREAYESDDDEGGPGGVQCRTQ